MSAPETDSDAARRPPLSPLEGGRWRPVQPHELLRRGGGEEQDSSTTPGPRVPTRERRQELEHYIKDRPADIDAYLELAAIYREANRTVEATRVLKAALEVEPEHADVLWQLEEASLARSLQQLKDVKDVTKRLSTPEAHRELERAQIDWANRRAEVCRARLQRNPTMDHLRVVLAEALRDLNQPQEAINALEPALANDAEAPLAYLILGHCRVTLGDELGALAAYRHCAMRRAVPAPPRLRVTAMRLATEIAERLGLTASLPLYRQAWQQAESELDAQPSTSSLET